MDDGSLNLFRNEFCSQPSINRTMMRFTVGLSGEKAHRKVISSLRFMEETVLISASLDGSIRIWDCTAHSATSQVTAIESRDGISALEIPTGFGEGAVIVSGSTSGALHVRDMRTQRGEGDKSLKAHNSAVSSLCFDNAYGVLSADTSGNIEQRDVRSMRTIPMLRLNGSKKVAEGRTIGNVQSISDVKKRANMPVSEDIWDVAMGRKRKVELFPEIGVSTKATKAPPLRFEERAHSTKVLTMSFVEPCRIGSLGQDKALKVFCGVTGDLLQIYRMEEKPLAGCFSNGKFLVATRSRVQVMEYSGSAYTEGSLIVNPHAGGITALCPAGAWGFCSGGTDKHVFISSI
jgi:hypothetical protein